MEKEKKVIKKEVDKKELDKYSFSPSILKQSAGSFKAFVKDRYSKLKADEVNYLTEKFYSEK